MKYIPILALVFILSYPSQTVTAQSVNSVQNDKKDAIAALLLKVRELKSQMASIAKVEDTQEICDMQSFLNQIKKLEADNEENVPKARSSVRTEMTERYKSRIKWVEQDMKEECSAEQWNGYIDEKINKLKEQRERALKFVISKIGNPNYYQNSVIIVEKRFEPLIKILEEHKI